MNAIAELQAPSATDPPEAGSLSGPLAPAALTLWRLHAAMGSVFLLVPTGVLALFPLQDWIGSSALGLWFLLAIVYAAIAWRLTGNFYRSAYLGLEPLLLRFRRGRIWWKETIVPRSRMQFIDVTQGPLERRLGLSTLVVHTAGMMHARLDIQGLEEARAHALRDALLATAINEVV